MVRLTRLVYITKGLSSSGTLNILQLLLKKKEAHLAAP